MAVVNIAAYQFTPLENLPELQAHFKSQCQEKRLKGTILLSPEGINIMLAGEHSSIGAFKTYLRQEQRFNTIVFKESLSDIQPFKRLFVKIKKEAVTMGVQAIRPDKEKAPSISASRLKVWLEKKNDFTLLDVRNHFEIEYGTFEGATELNLRHFREFPEALKKLPDELRQKPVVMFCTGGIRCEKAGLLMQQYGFKEVYQLEGGILQYFAEEKGAYFNGDCFVFDERIALDKQLKPIQHKVESIKQ